MLGVNSSCLMRVMSRQVCGVRFEVMGEANVISFLDGVDKGWRQCLYPAYSYETPAPSMSFTSSFESLSPSATPQPTPWATPSPSPSPTPSEKPTAGITLRLDPDDFGPLTVDGGGLSAVGGLGVGAFLTELLGDTSSSWFPQHRGELGTVRVRIDDSGGLPVKVSYHDAANTPIFDGTPKTVQLVYDAAKDEFSLLDENGGYVTGDDGMSVMRFGSPEIKWEITKANAGTGGTAVRVTLDEAQLRLGFDSGNLVLWRDGKDQLDYPSVPGGANGESFENVHLWVDHPDGDFDEEGSFYISLRNAPDTGYEMLVVSGSSLENDWAVSHNQVTAMGVSALPKPD